MAKDETLETEKEEEVVSEENETGIVGGPGSLEDSIVHPPMKEEGAEEVVKEEKEAEAEGAAKKEGEETPPQHKFKTWEEAEKAHAAAEKKMREANEELARQKQVLAQSKPSEAKPLEQQVVKKVWQREKEEFETRRKQVPVPTDLKDKAAVDAYNSQVSDLYFEVHAKYAEIAAEERVTARQESERVQGWISTEAKKYGMDDTPFELKNEDGTVERGTLLNVFWGVAQNPAAFGVSIRSEDGKVLPLGEQVKAIARGINRFVDGIVVHRQALSKKAEGDKKDLTVLRRGSTGPSKAKEEEEEDISTFAEGLQESKKSRRKAGDFRRRSD